MSEPTTTLQEEPKVRPATELISKNQSRWIEVPVAGYETVRIRANPITRGVRNDALEVAAADFVQKYQRGGYSPTVFEREVVLRIVKEWNLGVDVQTGWDLLPQEVGDSISEALGIAQAIKDMTPVKSKAVQDAKNSSTVGSPPTGPTPPSSQT